MFHDHKNSAVEPEEFAALGSDVIAYVRKISGSEINAAFPDGLELERDETYWGLFAADGQPLMYSNQLDQVLNGAFYNDLCAVYPN